MYKALKAILWGKIDLSIEARFGFRPRRQGGNWRLYTDNRTNGMVFLTVEYFDTAGGKFLICGGISAGGFPKLEDVSAERYTEPVAGGFTLVGAEAFGFPAGLIEVEL